MIVRLITSVFFGSVILFLLLLFGLREYAVHTEDGIRLEIPFLMDEPPAPEEGTRNSLIGFILGAISGIFQYRLISKFVGVITSGEPDRITKIIATAKFLLPFIVLLAAALLLRGDILWAVIGIITSPIVLTLSNYIRSGKKRRT